ncbi:MAG TPA: acetoacetate decarboxylase family protein [Stenomitos sp.]
MSYPPAPWHLYGNALQSFHLIDLETAKIVVPPDLEIVFILPGKTLGGLYLSVYDENSTLSYHELIVVSALVRYQGIIGSWISHIYVDHPDSVQGGRNIWGLPKEMADFNWNDRHIEVSQGNLCLCRAQYSQVGLPLSFWYKYNISGNVFSGLSQDVLKFQGNFETRLKWVPCQFSIPSESPFSSLNLAHPLVTVQMQELHLTAKAPSIVGQWSSKVSTKTNSL